MVFTTHLIARFSEAVKSLRQDLRCGNHVVESAEEIGVSIFDLCVIYSGGIGKFAKTPSPNLQCEITFDSSATIFSHTSEVVNA
jgi:hypothetical protein